MARTSEARRTQIAKLVASQGSAQASELARAFGVSVQTVRQDLARLEEVGLVMRTRGGAKAVEMGEVGVGAKAASHAAEKGLIAQAAVRLVSDGDVVWIGPGSTTLALARLLRLRRGLTVVTNSLRAADVASGCGNDVVLAGGTLEQRALATCGATALELAGQVNADVVFVGCDGFDRGGAPTMTSPEILAVMRSAMRRGKRSVLLADASKFGRCGTYRVCEPRDFSCLVTDALSEEGAWADDAFGQVICAAKE